MYSWRGIQYPFAGGNIRMEVGISKDVWFKSCTDLVMSRFFPLDFLPLAITGMQVLKVTRIHNRFLQDRFERILEAQVSWQSHSRWSDCYTSYSINLRNHSDGVFWVGLAHQPVWRRVFIPNTINFLTNYMTAGAEGEQNACGVPVVWGDSASSGWVAVDYWRRISIFDWPSSS